MKKIILIVDDDQLMLNHINEKLEQKGFITRSYSNGRSAIYAIKNQGVTYDMALIDLSLPDIGGDKVAECSKIINPKIPVYAFTAYRVAFNNTDGLIRKNNDIEEKIENAFKKI